MHSSTSKVQLEKLLFEKNLFLPPVEEVSAEIKVDKNVSQDCVGNNIESDQRRHFFQCRSGPWQSILGCNTVWKTANAEPPLF